MIHRIPFQPKIAMILALYAISFSPVTSWGQKPIQNELVYGEGRISDALHASMIPNNRTVGVYLIVGEQNEVAPQDWAATVEKYFKAYGVPVKIILYDKRPEGKGASAVIYVGAKAYKGNLSTGSVGLSYFLKEHAKVFSELLEMYKKANPDLFPAEN